MAAWAIISFLSYSAYSIFCHGRWGQTVGKRVMGVTVMDVSEDRLPTYWQAFLRDSFYVGASVAALFIFWYFLFTQGYSAALHDSWVSYAIGWASVGWAITEVVTMLSNNKRRALHDWIASTVVVRT